MLFVYRTHNLHPKTNVECRWRGAKKAQASKGIKTFYLFCKLKQCGMMRQEMVWLDDRMTECQNDKNFYSRDNRGYGVWDLLEKISHAYRTGPALPLRPGLCLWDLLMWCYMKWCDVMWCDVAWHGMAWHDRAGHMTLQGRARQGRAGHNAWHDIKLRSILCISFRL